MPLQHKLTPAYSAIDKYFDLNCFGLENISKKENYIFAMNHQSILDVPLAFSVLAHATETKIHLFLSRHFYLAFLPLTLPLETISIKMDKTSPNAQKFNRKQLVKGVKKLNSGNSILIYPEGIISGGKRSRLQKAGTGAVRMAISAKVSIIPIGIRGSNHAYPFLLKNRNPLHLKRRQPIYINIGEEISLKEFFEVDLSTYSQQNRGLLRSLTHELMLNLSELSSLPYVNEFIRD